MNILLRESMPYSIFILLDDKSLNILFLSQRIFFVVFLNLFQLALCWYFVKNRLLSLADNYKHMKSDKASSGRDLYKTDDIKKARISANLKTILCIWEAIKRRGGSRPRFKWNFMLKTLLCYLLCCNFCHSVFLISSLTGSPFTIMARRMPELSKQFRQRW